MICIVIYQTVVCESFALTMKADVQILSLSIIINYLIRTGITIICRHLYNNIHTHNMKYTLTKYMKHQTYGTTSYRNIVTKLFNIQHTFSTILLGMIQEKKYNIFLITSFFIISYKFTSRFHFLKVPFHNIPSIVLFRFTFHSPVICKISIKYI